jgi:hypothetical protein
VSVTTTTVAYQTLRPDQEVAQVAPPSSGWKGAHAVAGGCSGQVGRRGRYSPLTAVGLAMLARSFIGGADNQNYIPAFLCGCILQTLDRVLFTNIVEHVDIIDALHLAEEFAAFHVSSVRPHLDLRTGFGQMDDSNGISDNRAAGAEEGADDKRCQ